MVRTSIFGVASVLAILWATERHVSAQTCFQSPCTGCCIVGPCCKGDLNFDDRVDGGDIQDFAAVLAGGSSDTNTQCRADIDCDSANTLADVDPFVAQLLSDTPCTCGAGFSGDMNVNWIHGSSNCSQNTDPPIQVHRFNDNTYILRQNKCINYEAPFIYLFFGTTRVFMQDTGATSSAITFPIRATVQTIIANWLVEHQLPSIQLIVTHSHGHGDHTAGDLQFSGQPNTTLVGTSQTAVRTFFGITIWPTQIVQYDLGGRILDIIPIPGHQTAHIAVYDRQTDWLLTGDTLYPGRLYISIWADYKASIARLYTFAQTNNIAHCMGTHIEMTNTPGVDYPIGTTYQPNEHPLPLDLSHLVELYNATQAMGNSPFQQVHNDFIIYPL